MICSKGGLTVSYYCFALEHNNGDLILTYRLHGSDADDDDDDADDDNDDDDGDDGDDGEAPASVAVAAYFNHCNIRGTQLFHMKS